MAVLLLLALASLAGRATHLVGGEMYYENLGGNNYLVTLKVYRDCGPTNTNGTGFDNFASVGIFTNSGALAQELLLSLADAQVNYVPVTLENPCFVLPPDVCVEEAIYQGEVYLPSNTNGYNLCYQRCCRNPSIININFPENSGATFFTHIPGTNATSDPNSCPYFNNFPPVALCANAAFWFDHSATDPDGDVLEYSFCTPQLGGSPDFPAPAPPSSPPFNPISWATGFSAANPVTANPGFAIDPATGWLTGTPTQVGQYVVGICVKEYRNGVLLSETNRDFQFNVTICDPNIVASIPDQVSFCDGLTILFDNESINAEDFYWDFGVLDSDDDWSTEAEPLFQYPDTGTYNIMLIANPSWPCADTAYAQYTAYPLIAPVISVPSFECVDGLPYFDFEAVGDYEIDAAFLWDFGPTAEVPLTDVSNPEPVYFGGTGTYEVSLTLLDNGCDSTVSVEIVVPTFPQAEIVTQEIFCDGFEFDFGNASQFAEEYWWEFGDPNIGGDYSTDYEPSYTYSEAGLYTVTLVAFAPLTCPDTTTSTFEIHTLLNPWFEEADPQCFEGNSFDFYALGTEDSGAVYEWDFGSMATPSSSSVINPQNITYAEPGIYEVELVVSENGCVRDYSDEVIVVANPEFDWYLFHGSGCPPFYATFIDQSTSQTQLFYFWDFGDGASSTASDPIHIYSLPGTYDVSVIISTANGCVQEEIFYVEDAVTVFTPPSAGIDVEPNTVNILEPTVFINDLSKGGIDCDYFISDGGFIDECDSYYTFSDGGIFDIYQVVTNIHGCRDTAHAQVAVEGFMFYAPNAFTPNNDGQNDIWLPSTIGVTKYHLLIHNRWGEVIFETRDPKEPWLGNINEGEHYAADGVYIYHAVIEDLLKLPHEFTGHISVVR